MMLPLSESSERTVLRFDAIARWSHRVFGILMGVCLLTAALLYLPELSGLVGRRDVVRLVHIWAGVLLPVPVVLGYVLSARYRRDVRRLSRFTPADWRWLRPSRLRPGDPVGKFNAGQKLNASFTWGAVLVMLATGLMMTFPDPFADTFRTGATFVHDWLALAVAVVAVGHMYKAYEDPEARAGMRNGYVSPQWARIHHNHWAEMVAESNDDAHRRGNDF